MRRISFGIALISLLLMGAVQLQAGVVLRLFYDDTGDGVEVSNLTSASIFPDAPTYQSIATDALSFHPGNPLTDYGTFTRGYITAPTTGDYVFFLSSDDGAEFWLSTDDTPANKKLVAFETGCCTPLFSGDRLADRSSDPIHLEQGKQYYFEALNKQGSGGEYIDVGWQKPDGTQELVPGAVLMPFPLDLTSFQPKANEAPVILATLGGDPYTGLPYAIPNSGQPASTNIVENQPATFLVTAEASAPVTFQWKKNGQDIAGATLPLYTIPHAKLSDDGASITVEIKNGSGSVTSQAATLSVTPDTTPPALVTARGSAQPQGIVVSFSESVDEASATNISNYSFSGQNLTISGASLLANERDVLLQVSEYTTDPLTLKVSGVKDQSQAGNTVAAGSSASVVFKTYLAAFWNFNQPGDPTKTTDLIGGIEGNVLDGAAFTPDQGGQSGQPGDYGMDFGQDSSQQRVEVKDVGFLNQAAANDQITIAFWQKRWSVANSSSCWAVSPSSSGSERGINVHVPWGNNNIYFDTAGCCDTGTQRINADISTFPDNKTDFFLSWHHFAFVKNGADKQIWIDGKLFLEGQNTSPLPTDFSLLVIGAAGDAGNSVQGVLDDFAVFDAPLTKAEIGQLAQGQSPTDVAEPIAGPLTISQQPKDQSVTEQTPVTFSVAATGTPALGIVYQWYRDGQPIDGANSASYTIDTAKLGDNGAVFHAVVMNADGSYQALTSQDVKLTVTADTTPPEITDVHGGPPPFQETVVTFSEPVDSATATNAANYKLDNGITVQSATLSEDGTTVTLETSAQTSGSQYTLSVSNVKDRAGTPNTIVPTDKSYTEWAFTTGAALEQKWDSLSADSLDALRSDPRFPDNPTSENFISAFEWPPNGGNEDGDHYGNKLSGWIIPPTTGNYVFFLSSDDHSQLFLSTDEDPANKVMIAEEPSWNNPRQWVATSRRDANNPENRSDTFQNTAWPGGNTINLQAGKRYYIEAIHQEGTGGDNVGVAWELPGEDPPTNGAPPIAGSDVATLLPLATKIPNGPVEITAQPADQTVAQGLAATITGLEVSGAAPYSYQWQVNGQDVAGANSDTLTIDSVPLSDDGAKVTVEVSNFFSSVTSQVATLTVNADTTPPSVVAVGSLDGGATVGVFFSEEVDQATAETASNYSIPGATITTAQLDPDNPRHVILTATGVPNAITLTVNGVQDRFGNAASNATGSGTSITLTSATLGTPLEPGSATISGLGVDVTAGGADIWGNSDNGYFVYTQWTGDFDARVQIIRLDHDVSAWTKAGLDMREEGPTNNDSRHADVILASGQDNGNGIFDSQYRQTKAGSSDVWPGANRAVKGTNPGLPNAWVRLTRKQTPSGDVVTDYRSSDGIQWTQMDQTTLTPSYPDQVFVGMVTTSHNDAAGQTTVAQYRNFSITDLAPAPVNVTMSASLENGKLQLSWAPSQGTLQSAASVTGPWSNVAGATNPMSISPDAAQQFYRVEVSP